jgi:hypothetical protein
MSPGNNLTNIFDITLSVMRRVASIPNDKLRSLIAIIIE